MKITQVRVIAMSDPVRDITFAKKIDGSTAAGPLATNMAFYIGPFVGLIDVWMDFRKTKNFIG